MPGPWMVMPGLGEGWELTISCPDCPAGSLFQPCSHPTPFPPGRLSSEALQSLWADGSILRCAPRCVFQVIGSQTWLHVGLTWVINEVLSPGQDPRDSEVIGLGSGSALLGSPLPFLSEIPGISGLLISCLPVSL